MSIREHFEDLNSLSPLRFLQVVLDYNCAMQYRDIRLAMSQFGTTLLEPPCYYDVDDVTTRTCRIPCRHHLQPKRHQVTSINILHQY